MTMFFLYHSMSVLCLLPISTFLDYNPKETITVGNDGQATLSAPNRGYSIWVLKMEI
jgi:hypothetical protein